MTDTSNSIDQATNIFLGAIDDLGSLKDQNTQLSADKAGLLQQVAGLQAQLAQEVQENTDDETAIKTANDLAAQSQAAFDQYKQGEETQKSALNDAIASLRQKISDLTVAPPLPTPPVVPTPDPTATPVASTPDPSTVTPVVPTPDPTATPVADTPATVVDPTVPAPDSTVATATAKDSSIVA